MIIEQHINDGTEANKNMGSVQQSEKSADETNATGMDLRRLFSYVGAAYWLFMTIIVVPVGCVLSLSTVIYPLMLFCWLFGLRISFVNRIEHYLCCMVNQHWTAAGQYIGLSVSEYGDDLNEIADKRVLFLCNHLGLVDHFALMTAFNDKRSLAGRYLWVIFNIWKWTPLGIQWTCHGNFFINGGARAIVLKEFREHLKALYWKFGYGFVVMYPEGSRLYLIRESEKRFAEKNNLPALKNCAHPRTGAAHSTILVAGKSIKDERKANSADLPPIEYVVDATLGYPKGEVVDLGNAILGEWPNNDPNVAVHYKIHKLRQEWQDEEEFKKWLYEQYEEKDKLLEKFYATGSFGGKRRMVNFPISRSLFVEFFWLAIFYLHYNTWFKPLFLLILSSCGL